MKGGTITEYLYRHMGLRPLCCWCCAFSAAVFGAVYLLHGVAILLLGGLLLFFGVALRLRARKITGGILASAALGLAVAWVWSCHASALTLQWPGRVEPVTVTALDYPAPTRRGVWIETRIEAPAQLKGERLLLWAAQPELTLSPGDRVEAVAALHSGRESRPEWEYWNYSNGVFLTASARSVTVTPRKTPLSLLPRVAAHRLAQALERHFPQEESGFLLALCIGDTSRLSGELDDALKVAGLRHVAAASGLHVSVLTAAVMLLPGRRRGKSLLLLPLLIGYAALAGFSPSITRAVVMQTLLLTAPLLEREPDGPTSLSLALALLLVQNPYAAASISLQLSFAAMLGIVLITPTLTRERSRWEKPGETALRLGHNLLALTFGAGFLTLPLCMHTFGWATTLSPVSSLGVLWLLQPLLPMALLTAAAGTALPSLAAALAVPTLALTRVATGLIYGISALPHVILWDSTLMELWLLLCFTVLSLRWAGMLSGRAGGLAAVGLALGLLLCGMPEGQLTFELLDVGQGQCILLCAGDTTAVIDCGSAENRAYGELTNTLRRRGRESLDCLLLTHYDSDHINGVPALLAEVPVRELLLPVPQPEDQELARSLAETAREYGAEVTLLDGQTALRHWDGLGLTAARIGTGSNSGLAALVELEGVQILLTGDGDWRAEGELLQRWPLERLDVLVAGHHGSATSTGEALLAQTRPKAVLISVGENGYGHPDQGVLERCEGAGADIWRTDRSGTVCIAVDGSGRTGRNMLE